MIRRPTDIAIQRPAAVDASEIKALAFIDRAAAVNEAVAASQSRLWGIRYELPDGERFMLAGGQPDVETARERLDFWLRQNREAKYDLATVRAYTADEAQEVKFYLLQRYPRRKSLAELGGGEWGRCFKEPWRVPGSRVKNPQAKADAGGAWGRLARW